MQSAKTSHQAHSPRSELGTALRACRSAFVGVGVMSLVINILYLTGSFFMLEIYDRVLPSRSIPTLVGLIVLAGGLYVVQGILDLIRGRILIRIGSTLDEMLSRRVYDIVVRMPLVIGNRSEGLQPLRDLDNVRSFLSGMGPGALYDLPWLPLYLAICFAFHPLIGITALVGAIILIALTLLTEYLTHEPMKRSTGLAMRRPRASIAVRETIAGAPSRSSPKCTGRICAMPWAILPGRAIPPLRRSRGGYSDMTRSIVS